MSMLEHYLFRNYRPIQCEQEKWLYRNVGEKTTD